MSNTLYLAGKGPGMLQWEQQQRLQARFLHMVPWVTRQKIKYTLGFLSLLFLLLAPPLMSALSRALDQPETCYDGIRNQDERDVDCGGVCTLACAIDVQPLSVEWSKTFEINQGLYDVAALVENPNQRAGASDVAYTFDLYDKKGGLIESRSGVQYINAAEQIVIFEGSIFTSGRTPDKVTFSINNNPTWVQATKVALPLKIKRDEVTDSNTEPRLDAIVENEGFTEDLIDLDVVALVYDKDGEIIAASQTYINDLPRRTEVPVAFSWPTPFRPSKVTECADLSTIKVTQRVIPNDIVLVFDRSGSMNDDTLEGSGIPEPITTAKGAATQFLSTLRPQDQVGLVSFATEASTPMDRGLTLDHLSVAEAIRDVRIGTPDNQQHTNLGDAIASAVDELSSLKHNAAANSHIIALTDGVVTRPLDPALEEVDQAYVYAHKYAKEKAERARDFEIDVFVIGLGEGVVDEEEYLANEIATTPGHYYKAETADDLSAIYTRIAESVSEESLVTEQVCNDKNVFIPKILIRTNRLQDADFPTRTTP